jgi:hypothetical protein
VKPLIIEEEAEAELAGFVAFYEQRQSGLGLEFDRSRRSRHPPSLSYGEAGGCLYRRNPADLQLLGGNLRWGRRRDNWLLARSIGDRFNQPLPAAMAVLVVGPGCATAVPDLPSPVIAVGWDREHIRERGRDHHSAQHSNQICAYHFSFPHVSLFNRFEARHQAGSFLHLY